MKKLLALFITLQLITNHEAFAEMVKLPFLFHHYNETSDNTTFIEFLKTHYSETQHENSDHDHGKLPFKHSEDGCSHHPSPVISVVIKTDQHYELKPAVFSAPKIVFSNDEIPSLFINTIWQPPKLA
jgi:hypothetical protein